MTVHVPRFEAKKSRTSRLGRKVVALAGTAALVTGIAAGIGTGSAAAASKPFCTSSKLTVTVFNFSEIPFKGALAGFEKYCPSVKVTYAIQTTAPTYQTTLQTQKLSGQLTDIIETYDSLSPTLEVDGVVAPLNKYLNAKSFYPASYWLKGMSQSYIPPKGAQPSSFVGKQFFVPIEADATVFYVNNKLLGNFTINGSATTNVTSSGGTIGDDWTWQQAETVWSALTKGSVYGVCERPDWQAQWNPFITAEGETAMGATKADLNGAGALAAWALLIAPEQNGSGIPFATLQKNGDQCDPSFTSGAAAMSIGVRGDLPSLQAALGAKNFNVLPIPEIPGASGMVRPTGGGSVGWCLAPNATTNKLALAFLKYLFSSAGQAIGEKTGGVIPAEPSQNGPKAVWRTTTGIGPANTQAFITAAATATIAPQTPGTVFNESNTDVPIAVQEATTGGQSIATAFGNLQSQMNAAYASNS